MSNTIELPALLELADQVIDQNNSDNFFENLEAYALAFDGWFAVYGEGIQKGQTPWSRSDLDRLLEKHETIAQRTTEVQATIPEEMRKLKMKGKGIMAYTDLLPKKISLGKGRKG